MARKKKKKLPQLVAIIGTDFRGNEWISPWRGFADVSVKRSGREIGFMSAPYHAKTAQSAVATMKRICERLRIEVVTNRK